MPKQLLLMLIYKILNEIMMNWKVLKTENDYTTATNRLMEIFQAIPGTPEGDEMELLMVLVKDYDDKHYVVPQPDPLEAIKYKMQERGIKAKDLEPIIGSKGYVSSILSGRREITLKMAKKLKDYFQLPAEIFLPTA
jgi:HTH-type transcriptional regulator/antitoxin HigA